MTETGEPSTASPTDCGSVGVPKRLRSHRPSSHSTPRVRAGKQRGAHSPRRVIDDIAHNKPDLNFGELPEEAGNYSNQHQSDQVDPQHRLEPKLILFRTW